MQIKDILYNDFIIQLSDLLTKIAGIYGLKEADPGFVAYFANTLKKYFGNLTFEQIESAFEYNSIGSLNEYLPKKGFSTDNKVDYNIPDMVKIIKAYTRLKKIDEDMQPKACQLSRAQINETRKQWCEWLISIFEKYRDTYERSQIGIPVFTCELLARLGQLNPNDINKSGPYFNINLPFQKKRGRDLHNENLIFETFDKMIGEGIEMRQLIHAYQNEYSNEMPFN